MRFLAFLAALVVLAGCATRPPRPATPFSDRATAPAERPGIGTGSGEWRAFPAHPAYFVRAWSGQPSGTAKLFYNDRDGVNAMLDHLGGEPRPASGLQKCAGGIVRMGLRDGAGHWLDAWEVRGHRVAVGGRGARYEVVLKNESQRRVEVVVSVDGLDVVDGRSAGFEKRGYILEPREIVAIEGFRAGRDGAAAFRFVGVGDTYAQRRYSDTRNVGVVGLAVFSERWGGTPASAIRQEHRAWRIGQALAPLPDA